MQGNLAEALNPQPMSRANAPYDGMFRWTECIGCPAAPLHKAMGCQSRTFDAQTLALFHEGILHEYDLKARIRELGVEIMDIGEKGLKVQGYPIVFHPDGVIWNQREILETKSFDDESTSEDFLSKHPQYVLQAGGYASFLNLDHARLIAKNRSTGWVLDDMEIPRDDAKIQPYLDNVRRVESIIASGATSCQGPWYPACSQDFLTRLFCPYNEVHCTRSDAQSSAELDTLLLDYAIFKSATDPYLEKQSQLRTMVEILMTKAGFNRITSVDGVTASKFSASYWTSDREEAEKILDAATFKKIFYKVPREQLRITVPKSFKKP